MQLFYTPDHARVGDVIPYYENGEFKLFYLKNWNPYFGSDKTYGWHLLTTKDLIHYESETAIGILGGTGCIIKVEGLYHLYYCVFEDQPQRQYVCHATSTDLTNWTKYPDETFGPDESIYLLTDWRDPHVIWNEEEKRFSVPLMFAMVILYHFIPTMSIGLICFLRFIQQSQLIASFNLCIMTYNHTQ